MTSYSSMSSLEKLLHQAEQELSYYEQSTIPNSSTNSSDSSTNTTFDERISWKQLQLQVEQLEIWHSVTCLAKQHHDNTNNNDHHDGHYCIDLLEQLEQLLINATQQKGSSSSTIIRMRKTFIERLAQQEYYPWHAYYQSKYTKQLQTLLQQYQYPNSCESLLIELEDDYENSNVDENNPHTPLQQIQYTCHILERLAASQTRLNQYGYYNNTIMNSTTTTTTSSVDIVTRELMRPWVKRLTFHFLQEDLHRPTTYRIEKLPEWLFSYVQTHIFQNNPHSKNHDRTIWDMISYIMTNPSTFLHELIRLIQYIFTERNLFRHEMIVGPTSNPNYLMNAIEQLLLFDSFVQQQQQQASTTSGILRLMDVFVVGDDELWDWWLQQEMEVTWRTLSDHFVNVEQNKDNNTSMTTIATSSIITSLAEVLCAQLRSMWMKASCLSLPGSYMTHVVAPVCTRFLDVWRDMTDDFAPTEYTEWNAWIQGTHSIVTFLQTQQQQQQIQEDGIDDEMNNLMRFASSLQSLEDAVVDDFAKTLVDRVFLVDAKLASFLMRASFQVASNDANVDDQEEELIEVRHALAKFYEETDDQRNGVSSYSSHRMRETVISFLADQFLHVALNMDGMTPELGRNGSLRFAQQVQSVLDIVMTDLPVNAQRLLDVTRWMSMETTELSSMGNALCGLAGVPAPLTMQPFLQDDRLTMEAMDMIQAKGYRWIELDDVISILNRRMDLGGP